MTPEKIQKKKSNRMRQTTFPPGDAIHVVLHGTTTAGQISKSLGIYATMKTTIHQRLVSFWAREWDKVWSLAELNNVKLTMIDLAFQDCRYKITMKRALEVLVKRADYDEWLAKDGGVFVPLSDFTITGKMIDGVEVVMAPDPEDPRELADPK